MLKVDVLFFIDVTGSMGSFISQAKKFLGDSSNELVEIGADVKFFVTLYRDHPPQDSTFASKVIGNCVSKKELSDLLQKSRDFVPAGGGDAPESGLDAIMQISDLTLRQGSQRFGFIVGDAPLHGTSYVPNAKKCACGKSHFDAIQITEKYNIEMTGVNVSGHNHTTLSFKSFCRSVIEGSNGVASIVKRMKEYAETIHFAETKVLPLLKVNPFMPVSDIHKQLDISVQSARSYIEVLNALEVTKELSTNFEEVIS